WGIEDKIVGIKGQRQNILMGNHKSKLKSKEIDELSRVADFSALEIQNWFETYKQNCKHGRNLTLEEFQDLYQDLFPGDTSTFSEHMFRSFDLDKNGRVDFREFLIGLSVVSSLDIEKKLKWSFNMYDIDGNGYISQDEMIEILRAVLQMNMLTDHHSGNVETPEEMADKLFKKMDKNNDNQISWEEFKSGAQEDKGILSMLTGLNNG
ncbi:hypothetical protein ScPMuIL_000859, partial [Solemya velum]